MKTIKKEKIIYCINNVKPLKEYNKKDPKKKLK